VTPDDGLAAVFEGPGRPFRRIGYPLRPPGPGAILVRVLLSTICGSDVHAWAGRRAFPVPGILGLYSIAMARAAGAASVVALEAVPSRQVLARRFGADAVLDPTALDADALGAGVRAYAPRGGADVVIETCGVPVALPQGLSVLRVGGRLVTAGLVVPGAVVTLDASEIVRRCITMRGVHNYHPRHLVRALDFVTDYRDRLPLGALVDATFPLAEAEGAFVAAAERRALRPAVMP